MEIKADNFNVMNLNNC